MLLRRPVAPGRLFSLFSALTSAARVIGHAAVRRDTARLVHVLAVAHLDHEEHAALPLLPRVLDRQAIADFFARHEGEMSPELFLPWVLDGAPTAVAERFVDPLPEHVRSMLIQEWQPARRRLVAAISVDRP